MTREVDPDGDTVPTFEPNDMQSLAAALGAAVQSEADWSITVDSDDLTDSERDALETATEYTIGSFTGIVNRQKYVPAGVFRELVDEYAEELATIFDERPSWADGLTDEQIMAEVVMPTEVADTPQANTFVNLWACYHSSNTSTAFDRLDLSEYSRLYELLSDVALTCVYYDVKEELAWKYVGRVNY